MPFQRRNNAKNALSALWEIAMRQQLRTIAGRGFGLRQQSGQAQLTVRFADGTRSSTNLRIGWEPSNAPSIVQAAAEVAKGVRAGAPLPRREERSSTLPDNTSPVWTALLTEYEHYRVVVLADISAKSFHRKYKKVSEVLSTTSPRNADTAMTACAVGEPGSRGRQYKLQACASLLNWATETSRLPPAWSAPPTQRYLGRATKEATPGATPMPDDLQLQLLSGLEGDVWLAVATLSLFGLRPWELRHLRVVGDTVFVTKGKTHSGGTTEPRTVVALPPVGAPPGLVQAVLAGITAGGLPRLGNCDTGASGILTNKLRRRASWKSLGGEYSLYSFRKRWGYRAGVVFGLAAHDAAALLGHNLQTHLRYYGNLDQDAAVESARRAVQTAIH